MDGGNDGREDGRAYGEEGWVRTQGKGKNRTEERGRAGKRMKEWSGQKQRKGGWKRNGRTV